MPFFGGFQYLVNNNRIVTIVDWQIPAGYKLTVDRITETTPANGVEFLAPISGNVVPGQMLANGGG